MEYSADHIRNVAIVGHGGAGKTTLVEALLFAAGAIDRLGAVDQGTSHSDFDQQEIRRKISLNATVLPLEWKGCKINLIDVPGYPDFIGDLHGVARAVEAMIIVTPAQDAVDVGFDNAWEIAEQEGLTRLIFVNKMERDNADFPGLMKSLSDRYGVKVVPIQFPIGHQTSFKGVYDLLEEKQYIGDSKSGSVAPATAEQHAEAEKQIEKMMDAAAEGDDDLAMKYLEGEALTEDEIEHGLEVGAEHGRVYPVLMGSALHGIGIQSLLDHIVGLVPSPAAKPKNWGAEIVPNASAPLSAFVFKTTADPYVGRINYVRVMTGTLKSDSPLRNTRNDENERIGSLSFPKGKEMKPASAVIAGDICAISKLQHTKTSDTLSDPKSTVAYEAIAFPDPIFRLAIVAKSKADEDKMGGALARIVEEDPTFQHRRDSELHQDLVEGMGDIHLDSVIEKLREKFGVNVSTTEANVAYRETIKSSAKAQGKYKKQSGGRGQYGDCHVELGPLPRGAGFEFSDSIVGGAIPKNYLPAIEKGIVDAMSKGFLAGYKVVDIKANVVHGSYHDVDSSEQAFKSAGALAFRNAAEQAHPTILEPVLYVEVDVPEAFTGDVMGDLNTRRGRPMGMEMIGPGRQRIIAEVPMATMGKYALDLRSITKGRGRFRVEFRRYDEMPANEQQSLISDYKKRRAEEADE